MAIKNPTAATEKQKENFKLKFAEIINVNENLIGKYSIFFFDTAAKSNYVFNGLDGKSMNILEFLSLEEREEYKKLKSDWQRN
jgi:hypothetical protein